MFVNSSDVTSLVKVQIVRVYFVCIDRLVTFRLRNSQLKCHCVCVHNNSAVRLIVEVVAMLVEM